MVSEYDAESDINDWLKVGLPIVRQLIGNLAEDDRSMHIKVDWRDSRRRDSWRIDSQRIDSRRIDSRRIDSRRIDSRRIDSRRIDSRRKDNRRKDKEPQIGFGGSLKLECKRCGYKHRIRNCPALGKRCHKCNEKGHFKKMCAKRINQMAYEEEQDVLEDSDSEPGLFSSYQVNHLTITPNLFMSESNININVNDWIESLHINEHKLNCKIDTGAQSNVISSDILNKITNSNQTVLNKCNVNLTAFGGNKIETLGSIELSVKLGNIVLAF